MKIVAVCGNGSGSSLIMEMMIKEVVSELKLDADVEHMSLNTWSPMNKCDLVFCGNDLYDEIEVSVNTKKIGLLNILDKAEIKKQLLNFMA